MAWEAFDVFWTYAPFFGFSALISGIVSIFINYRLKIKDFKKNVRIENLKEKIELYSYLLFELDKMRFMAQALKKTPGHTEDNVEDYAYGEKETFDNITKALKGKYHLLKQETFRQWMEVSTLFFHPAGLQSVRKLRVSLVEEYNGEIINEYKKLTGIKLDEKK